MTLESEALNERHGNILTSPDGRFQIESIEDHRGMRYLAWQVRGEDATFDGCWQFLGSYGSEREAKQACRERRKLNNGRTEEN